MDVVKTRYVDVRIQNSNMPIVISGVYQYDHGLQLRIRGISTSKSLMIHCAHIGLDPALPVQPVVSGEEIVADIPDVLLMQTKEVRCYVYVEDEASGRTTYEVRIPITPRPKPADFVFTPEQSGAYGQIVEELNALIQKVESATSDAEKATSDAKTAANNAKTVSDKLQNVTLEVEMQPPTAKPTGSVSQTATSTDFKLGVPTSNQAYATFEIDMEDGSLYMYSPEGFDDIDFVINADGELCVVI